MYLLKQHRYKIFEKKIKKGKKIFGQNFFFTDEAKEKPKKSSPAPMKR
jgi:hypothetical protein